MVQENEPAKGKGRPPGAPQPYPEVPMDTWLEGLSPTAHHLLDAARSILLKDGYAAVTLEAVALEAGEDKATIKRHFGSKAGLIHALFDDLGDEIFEEVNRRTEELPAGPERTHVMMRRLSGLARDHDTAQGMFELAPHALRDPILRERLATLYAWYRATMLEQSGMADRLAETPAYEDKQDIQALPALVMAVIDGMSLQMSLDPAAVDCDRVFALLDLFVTDVLEGRLHTGGKLNPPDVG
jgi:TetR/AcrR family transcriptional regulator, regulator of biofilm formation and stress response